MSGVAALLRFPLVEIGDIEEDEAAVDAEVRACVRACVRARVRACVRARAVSLCLCLPLLRSRAFGWPRPAVVLLPPLSHRRWSRARVPVISSASLHALHAFGR